MSKPPTMSRLQQHILAAVEQFERDLAAERRDAATVAERLDEAGRIRAQWKAIEADLPTLILAAADDGMEPPEISERLGISHASGYVARKLREARDASPEQAAETERRRWAKDYTSRHNRGEHATD